MRLEITQAEDLSKLLTTYYKAYIDPSPEGITLRFMEYYELHSTPCYSFCLQDHMIYGRRNIEDLYDEAKRCGWKIHRIHKQASRFAFPTKEQAYTHFIMMKFRQEGHLIRQLRFLKLFLDNIRVKHSASNTHFEFTSQLKLEDLTVKTENFMGKRDVYLIPNTEEKINDIYSFNW
jgi:hypothetical protein